MCAHLYFAGQSFPLAYINYVVRGLNIFRPGIEVDCAYVLYLTLLGYSCVVIGNMYNSTKTVTHKRQSPTLMLF